MIQASSFMSSVTLAAPFRAMYALGTLVFLGSCLVFAAAFTRNLLGGDFRDADASPSFKTIRSRERMSKLPPLVFGIFLVFTAAWFGVVGYSYLQLGRMQPVVDENTGDVNPPPLSGLAAAGQRVYAANGCVSCHTQQVRSGAFSTDVEKKLGPRPTVARDYLRERPGIPWETSALDPISRMSACDPPTQIGFTHTFTSRPR